MKTWRMLVSVGVLLCVCSVTEPAKRPRPFQKLEGHTDAVWCVAFSPDGKTIASGSADGTVRLWDVATGKQTCVLNEKTRTVGDVVFSNWNAVSDKVLFVGHRDGVAMYDLETGKSLGTLIGKNLQQLAVSRDGKWLLTAVDDKLHVWDVAKRKQIRTLYEHTKPVTAVAISADGAWCASRTADYRVWVFDRIKGKESARSNTLLLRTGPQRLMFTPDGKTLIATGTGPYYGMFVWDWQVCREVRGGYPREGRAIYADETSEKKWNVDGISDAAMTADGVLLTLGPVGLHFWDLKPPKPPVSPEPVPGDR